MCPTGVGPGDTILLVIAHTAGETSQHTLRNFFRERIFIFSIRSFSSDDPQIASSSALSHVPSQPMSIPSPRGSISRDSYLQLVTRNSLGIRGHVFEGPPAPDEPLSGRIWHQLLADLYLWIQEALRRTPRFARNFETWNSLYRAGGKFPQNLYDGNSGNSNFGTAFR